jgi:hypothetical protein
VNRFLLRADWLSNRVFESYNEISKLTDWGAVITLIWMRDCAPVGSPASSNRVRAA